MNSFIRKKLDKFYDKYHTRQLEAFFIWHKKQNFPSESLIQIYLPSLSYQCDSTRRAVSSKEIPRFIICTPTTGKDIFNKLNIHPEEWFLLFSSPYFEVWENKSLYSNELLPIRFGINDSEKKLILTRARNAINKHFRKAQAEEAGSEIAHANELVNIDVAVWVNGQLRGSQIILGTNLLDGIKHASLRAIVDERFKPIQEYELSKLRIEVTLMSDLAIPLYKHEQEQNEIYANKGYLAISNNNNKGWYVPAAFNCVNFSNLSELTSSLVDEKLKLGKDDKVRGIFTYEVIDFIESNTLMETMTLYGPVITNNYDKDTAILFKEISERSIDFLTNSQEIDGNIVPITNPQTGKVQQIDWARLAFTMFALTYYGYTTENETSVRIARNAYKFIENNASNLELQSTYVQCLAYVYIARAELILFPYQKITKFKSKIVPLLNTLSYEPILYSQYALYLVETDANNKDNLEDAKRCLEVILNEFENMRSKNYKKLSLASYPEIINILKIIDGENNISKTQEIINWYLSQQLPDGSFPSYTTSNFSYTRGTAKILEVLVNHLDQSHMSINATLKWLNSMQYSEKNDYFIKDRDRKFIQGGFRHDYFNQSTWIDASGHFLIAAANFAKIYKD